MRFILASHEEPRVLVLLRRVILALAVVHVALSAWSIYRRLVQVQRIDIAHIPSPVQTDSVVQLDVITSGETSNLMRLELVQRTQSVVLYERMSDVNRINMIDPRLFRYRPDVVVTTAALRSAVRPGSFAATAAASAESAARSAAVPVAASEAGARADSLPVSLPHPQSAGTSVVSH